MSPEMNADADVNLFGFLFLGVVRPQLGLNLLGALHGVDDGRKVHQEGITDGFDDLAVMGTHRLLNELIMDVQQPQHAGFVRAHLAAKADDVGEHDRREFAGLSRQSLVHTGDYSTCSLRLSTGVSASRH